MNLPEPKDIKWGESLFDFGHQYGLSIRVGTLSHAVRVYIGRREAPTNLYELKQILLHWYWRKLGAI